MITYKASDIIDAAMDVADLQNSNFIGHTEKIRVLNECFYELYQKCISAGDKTWLKTIEINKTIDLPTDFLQLQSITLKTSGTALVRKGDTESPNAPRYEIVNNQLVIYGYISEPILVKYWPTPITLTAPNIEEGEDTVIDNFTPGEFRTGLNSIISGLNFDYNPMEKTLTLTANAIYKNQQHSFEHVWENVSGYPYDGCCYTTKRTLILAAITDNGTYVYMFDFVLNREFAIRLHDPTFFENETNRLITFGREIGNTVELRDSKLYINDAEITIDITPINVKLVNGVIFVFGTTENEMAFIYSRDYGKTFSEPQLINSTDCDVFYINEKFYICNSTQIITLVDDVITDLVTAAENESFNNFIAIDNVIYYNSIITGETETKAFNRLHNGITEKIYDDNFNNVLYNGENYICVNSDGAYLMEITLGGINFTKLSTTPSSTTTTTITNSAIFDGIFYLQIATVTGDVTTNEIYNSVIDETGAIQFTKFSDGEFTPNSDFLVVKNGTYYQVLEANQLVDTNIETAKTATFLLINNDYVAICNDGVYIGTANNFYETKTLTAEITAHQKLPDNLLLVETATTTYKSNHSFTEWVDLGYKNEKLVADDEPQLDYNYYYLNGKLTRQIYFPYIDVNWTTAIPLTCGVHNGELTAWIDEEITTQTITDAQTNEEITEQVFSYNIMRLDALNKPAVVINLQQWETPNRVYDVQGYLAWGTGNGFTIVADLIDNSMMKTFQDKNISAFYGADYDGRYIVTDDFSDEVVERLWQPDTLLNYPNALFYPTLEYMMAIRFKMKQGDMEGMQIIQTVLNSRLEAFDKSIPRDQFGQTRINNFYIGGYY